MGRIGYNKGALLLSVAVIAAAVSSPAWAQSRNFNLPAQEAVTGIPAFARQAGVQILVSETAAHGKRTAAVQGAMSVDAGLGRLLAGTGLEVASNDGRTITLRSAAGPNGQGEASTQVTELVVTGTHLRGAAQLVSPHTKLDRSDLEDAGYPDVASALLKEPSLFGGDLTPEASRAIVPGGVESRDGNNYANGSSVDIHGLGADATLALFDGRRLPEGSSGAAPDISLIPMIVLDHIDIIRDGASSIYGADAVAGVVNFIPRKDFDGAETSAQVGSVTRGSYSTYQVGQIVGKMFEGGGVELAYQFDKSLPMSSTQRSVTRDQPPRTLFPDQIQNSLFARADYNINPSINLFSELLVGQRSFTDVADNSGDILNTAATTSQVVSNTGFTAKLPSNWTLTGGLQFDQNSMSQHISGTGESGSVSAGVQDVDVEATLSGTIVSLPAGGVQVAVGAEARGTHGTFSNSSAPSEAFNRRVYSAYAETTVPVVSAEMNIPLVRSFDLTGSVRYDRYSDFGGTTNPKIGAAWQVIDGIRVRSTYSTSFRAPSFFDQNESGSFADAFYDVYYTLGPSSPPTNNLVLFLAGGSGLRLKPEQAKNFTAGVDFLPPALPGLVAHIDYFNINFRNRIATPDGAVVNIYDLNAPDAQPYIIHNPTPAMVAPYINCAQCGNFSGMPLTPTTPFAAIIDDQAINLAADHVSGLDFDISYQFKTPLGDLKLSHVSEYMIYYNVAAAPGVTPVDVAGDVYFPPRYKARSGLLWSGRSGLSAALYWNFSPAYKDTQAPGNPPIASYSTFDANFRYAVKAENGPLHGVSILASVVNLLDTPPPRIVSIASNYPQYDAANSSALGRFVAVSIQKRW
jgi:iron complex outermembrane receptor protein